MRTEERKEIIPDVCFAIFNNQEVLNALKHSFQQAPVCENIQAPYGIYEFLMNEYNSYRNPSKFLARNGS